MELQHLTKTTCPDCGACTIAISQPNKHCNGQWFETREFKCGAFIRWVPNFTRQEQTVDCSENPALKARIVWQRATRDKVESYISNLKCPEGADKDTFGRFRTRLLRQVDIVNVNGKL